MSITITFRQASECVAADLGRVVHFKGFGRNIAFEEAESAALAECAVAAVVELRPDTLVWDGDSHHADSFTALIPRIWSICAPQLVMFLRDHEQDRQRVQHSWPSIAFDSASSSTAGTRRPSLRDEVVGECWPVGIECFLVKAGIRFDELGHLAMQATKGKDVVSVGGGPVVCSEFAATPSDVTYHLVPMSRRSDNPSGSKRKRWEACALCSLKDPPSNLKILQLADFAPASERVPSKAPPPELAQVSSIVSGAAEAVPVEAVHGSGAGSKPTEVFAPAAGSHPAASPAAACACEVRTPDLTPAAGSAPAESSA